MISDLGIQSTHGPAYRQGMARRPDPRVPGGDPRLTTVGPRRPTRLFLREWMDHVGLNGEQMAGRMDCSPGQVSKILKKGLENKVYWLDRFAAALGPDVETGDLYRHPDRPTQQDLLRGLPDDEHARIVRAIKALTGTDD